MATTPPAGLLDWEQTPQVLLYERAARGLKLERSGFAAVPGRSRLTWRRAEADGARAAPELAMPRRAPGQHPDAGAVSAPQLSTPARRRAVIPTVHSSTSVLRGGVRAKARPARLVRMGGAVYRVAAGRSLQRQPGTPRLGPVLRSAAKVGVYQRRGHTIVRVATQASPRAALSTAAAAVRARALARLTPARQAATPAHAPSASRRPASARRTAARPRVRKEEALVHCPAFCRSGRCEGRAKGSCPYVHDAARVAVCPRWLAGGCGLRDCPLQHAARPELMPICTFFLQGLCSNAHCGYLHVKLEPGAQACQAFLRGFCAAGASCPRLHVTPRMLRALRASRSPAAPAAAAQGAPGRSALAATVVEAEMAASGLSRRKSLDALCPAFLRA